MAKVLVPLAEGFEEIEAVTIIDVLRRAGIEVVVASLKDNEVKGANGITVVSDINIESANSEDFDMVVLPGGLPGAEHLKNSKTVQDILKQMNQKGKLVGAICAAPIALKSAGVLKNRYTCYPSFEDQIGKEGFSDAQKVVVDENVLTSRGPATAICFALEIVKKLAGNETYDQLKAGLLADYC